jgi:uncharacterized membrane protein YiaA
MRKRNTSAFTFLSWASFGMAICFVMIGIYNAEWKLVEKGFYAGCMLWAISSAFVLAKVVRDNDEDREDKREREERIRE